MATESSYPLYPILFFISFVLVLIPLPWHLQAWNVGTCSFMLWTAVASLSWFVNSIVWKDNAINWAPVWCDITSRIIIATSVAIPASSLTITRRLYKISRVQTVMSSQKERRKELAVDLSICVGLPVFVMILYYFVQGHRFNILEQIGCFPVTVNTPPAYAFVWMWPLLLGTISMVYCIFTIIAFLKRRREMSQFLNSSSQITFSRYFRLMVLAMMDTSFTIPLASLVIWLNTTQSEISPWKGLADVHWGFSRVEQIPAVLWRMERWNVVSLHLDRSLIIFCAVEFFVFFGFAEENRKNYARVYWTIMKRFGYYPKPKGSTFSNSSALRTPNLPVMSNQGGLKVLVNTDAKVEKRESFMSSIGDLSSSISVSTTYDERKDGKPHIETVTDSLPSSPDDIELPNLHNVPTTTNASTQPPSRPARCASLGDDVV
ncbi:STE3_2 [Sanghuangporus sanghuang]